MWDRYLLPFFTTVTLMVFHLFFIGFGYCVDQPYWLRYVLMGLRYYFHVYAVFDDLISPSSHLIIWHRYWLRFVPHHWLLGYAWDAEIGMRLMMLLHLSSRLPLYFCRLLWIWLLDHEVFVMICDDDAAYH